MINRLIILLLVFSNSMFSQVSSIRIGRDKVILEKVKGNEINIDTIKIKKVWFGSDYFYYKDLKIHLEKVDNGDFRDSLTSYVKKIILPPIKRSRFTSRVMQVVIFVNSEGKIVEYGLALGTGDDNYDKTVLKNLKELDKFKYKKKEKEDYISMYLISV